MCLKSAVGPEMCLKSDVGLKKWWEMGGWPRKQVGVGVDLQN